MHQDRTDLDRRAAVVSKIKQDAVKKKNRNIDAPGWSGNTKDTQCCGTNEFLQKLLK